MFKGLKCWFTGSDKKNWELLKSLFNQLDMSIYLRCQHSVLFRPPNVWRHLLKGLGMFQIKFATKTCIDLECGSLLYCSWVLIETIPFLDPFSRQFTGVFFRSESRYLWTCAQNYHINCWNFNPFLQNFMPMSVPSPWSMAVYHISFKRQRKSVS